MRTDLGSFMYLWGIVAAVITILSGSFILLTDRRRPTFTKWMFIVLIASMGYAFSIALRARRMIGLDGHTEFITSWVFESRTLGVMVCLTVLAFKLARQAIRGEHKNNDKSSWG